MSYIHAAGRRPISDVHTMAAAASRGSSPSARASARSNAGDAGSGGAASTRVGVNGGGRDGAGHHAARDTDFAILIESAIEAILAAGDRPDPVFGRFAMLNSLVRAVTYHEGQLLESGIARLAAENPALVLMPSETALPIVPAALEMLKRNDWSSLEGLRLPSEVHYKTSYSPDLFIVDRDRHAALIIDVKRSLFSVPERRLNALRTRMMASALIAGDWLHIEGRVAGVSKVDVAIIDGSSERRERGSGIFALDEIGELIGDPDAGEAMLRLRADFALRVQQEVHAACLRAIGRETGGGTAAGFVAGTGLIDEDVDPDPAVNADDDEGAELTAPSARSSSSSSSPGRRPIVVGFARTGVP